MNANSILVAAGILVLCFGIHLGLGSVAGIILLAAGLAMMFLR